MYELTLSFEEFTDTLYELGEHRRFSPWGCSKAHDWALDAGLVGCNIERDVLPLFWEYPDEDDAAESLGVDISHLDSGYGYPDRVCDYLEEQRRVRAEASGAPGWTVLVMERP